MKEEKKSKHIEWTIKLGAIGSLVLVALFVHWLDPSFYATMHRIILSHDMQLISETLKGYGPWAVLATIYLIVVVNMVGFLPAIVFSTASALVFGYWEGLVIAWFGECVGVIISFFIFRYLLRDKADTLIHKSKFLLKLDDFSEQNGFMVMLFARTVPYFPSGLITALGAISQITVKDYIVANLVGKFPSTAVEMAIGQDLVNIHDNMGRLAVISVIFLIIYYGIYKAYKWYMRRAKERDLAQEQAEGDFHLHDKPVGEISSNQEKATGEVADKDGRRKD